MFAQIALKVLFAPKVGCAGKEPFAPKLRRGAREDWLGEDSLVSSVAGPMSSRHARICCRTVYHQQCNGRYP